MLSLVKVTKSFVERIGAGLQSVENGSHICLLARSGPASGLQRPANPHLRRTVGCSFTWRDEHRLKLKSIKLRYPLSVLQIVLDGK